MNSQVHLRCQTIIRMTVLVTAWNFIGLAFTTGIAAESKTTSYFEHKYNGRYYVIGSVEINEAFKTTYHMPYTQTMISAGPGGETVVVEVIKEDPTHQERLWDEFKSRYLSNTIEIGSREPVREDEYREKGNGYPLDLWHDPTFKQQFIGTYAFTAAVEPRVSEIERQVLATILEFMSEDKGDEALAVINELFKPKPANVTDVSAGEWDTSHTSDTSESASGAESSDEKLRPNEGVAPGTRNPFARFAGVFKPKPMNATEGGNDESLIAEMEMVDTDGENGEESSEKPPDPISLIQNPSAVFAFIAGNIYFQRGDIEEASQWYEKAIQKFPSFLRAYKNLGMIDVRSGRHEQALKSLTKAVELGENSGLTYGLLGYAYAATGNYLAAESGFRKAILLQPESSDWKLGLTRALFEQQRFGETVTLCNQLITENPENATFWRLQASAYLGLNMPLKAAQNYEYLHVLGKAEGESLNKLGDIYLQEKMMDMAVEAYVNALEIDSEQPPEFPIRNAKLLAVRGAADQVEKLLTKIEDVYLGRLTNKQMTELLRLQARIAANVGTDEDQAKLLKEIVQIDPTDGEALISLGQYYARTDNPETAVFYYERAEEIERTKAKARIRHAQLLVQQSHYQQAIPLLKSALRIEHRDEVADYLKQVEAAAKSRL